MPTSRGRTARVGIPPKHTPPREGALQADQLLDQAFKLAEENFGDLWAELSEQGRRHFVQELFDARFADDHLAALSDVIDAWYRTLELRRSPGYNEAMADTGKTPIELEESIHTIEELPGLFKR